MPQDLIGKRILGYVVRDVHGSGAFGTVYRVAKSNPSGEYVRAMKHIAIPTETQYLAVLRTMGGDASKTDDYFRSMLDEVIREIQILNDLTEKEVPHIVRYYENDIVTSDSPRRYDVYILMEELTSLNQYLLTETFRVRDVLRMGGEILSGLEACHENGVIHRDIKEGNIFVSGKGEFKIGDFGVSKILKNSSRAESVKGSPDYLAPEVYLGKEGYTKSVDLYSLGIVLYRLLNMGRNPFLPAFPEPYSPQDEDMAFETRMRGQIPSPPLLGGEKIGLAVVKALLSPTERYQTAAEFRLALEEAMRETPAEDLDQPISIAAQSNSGSSGSLQDYGATRAETRPSLSGGNSRQETRGASLNQYLFEEEQRGRTESPAAHSSDPAGKTSFQTDSCETKQETGGFPPAEPPQVAAVDHKILGRLLWLFPALLLLVGVISYTVILPILYGEMISFWDLLFSNPQSILQKLRDPDAVLFHVNSMVAVKMFFWVWFLAFAASLFFAARQIHTRQEPISSSAVMIQREPFLLMQEVNAAIRQSYAKTRSRDTFSLLSAGKHLEERLSLESDFGRGNAQVIACETSIASELQLMLELASQLDGEQSGENLSALEQSVQTINSLLLRRAELKKR